MWPGFSFVGAGQEGAVNDIEYDKLRWISFEATQYVKDVFTLVVLLAFFRVTVVGTVPLIQPSCASVVQV